MKAFYDRWATLLAEKLRGRGRPSRLLVNSHHHRRPDYVANVISKPSNSPIKSSLPTLDTGSGVCEPVWRQRPRQTTVGGAGD